jgi:hypothetical protein
MSDLLNFFAVLANIFAAVVGGIAACIAALTYCRNSKLEKAKWLATLYEKFYESSQLKSIRDILDSREDVSLEIANLVREESSEFTDYLNFFEFVLYLKEARQLTDEEIQQMFKYYLDCLRRRPNIRDYIKANGYELLDTYLDKMESSQ